MNRLWIYLKDYKKESILAPLFKLLEAFFELFVPLVMASIIDRGIGNEDMGHIGRMGLCLVLLGVVGLASSITAQFFAAKAAVGFSTKVRQALFDHIQGLSYTRIDQVGTSTLITRMTSDVNQLQSGVNMVLRLFLRSPIIVFGAMIMAFTIDVKSALVFVVVIPVLAVIVFGIMLWTMPLYKKVQAALDRVLGITRENLTGVRVIRAFHQEEAEEERFRESNKALVNLQTFVGKISACMNPVTYIVVNAGVIALIYIGAIQVNVGNLTQGEVVAILNYMSQILVELVKLANLIILITKALASADRVSGVLALGEDTETDGGTEESIIKQVTGKGAEADAEREQMPEQVGAEMSQKDTESRSSKDSITPYLSFEKVSLTYEGAGAESLQNIDFTVNKGDTIGIIGGTGSGKTSLINLIPKFYPVTEGRILLEGTDIRVIPDQELRKRIGVVPQKAVLFKGTVRSNLMWGMQEESADGNASADDSENADTGLTEEDLEKRMWHALELAQAKEVVEGKEGQLDAEIAQNGKNLSGGQRQRLTIARALMGNPEILILDDSASALDYATDAKLRVALRSLEDTTTTFIVSQRTSSIRHADKIIVLEDGEMVGVGTHEELLENCTVYREIHYANEAGGRKESKQS